MKKDEDEFYQLAVKRLRSEYAVLALLWFREGREWAMRAPWVELVAAAMDAKALEEGNKPIEEVGEGFPKEVLMKFRNGKATGCNGSDYIRHWSRGLVSFWKDALLEVVHPELAELEKRRARSAKASGDVAS